MKLLRIEKERYIFHLARQERALLALILRLYPVIPSAHQPVSKSAPAASQASQRLLDEALAEQRADNKKIVDDFVKDPKRFEEVHAGFQLTLTAAEIDWLLQILNDVRVGSWILLGSPEEEQRAISEDDPNAPHAWAMDLAGFFQMNFLRALGGTS